MTLSAGIIGLPNTGKSTLFNALSEAGVDAENYPFCTVDPNVGVVPVPDSRLHDIEELIQPEEALPATVEFVDIAGLVKGASEGEGLGNKFLSNIREVDALLHVVRCFEDEDVAHVEGSINPVRDVEIVQSELIQADRDTVAGRLEKAEKKAKRGVREEEERVNVLEEVLETLEESEPVRSCRPDERERELLRDSHLLTEKPVLYVANVDEEGLMAENNHVTSLRERAAKQDSNVIPVCALLEEELSDMDREEKMDMLSSFDLDRPVLDRIIRSTYDLLGLRTFFTIANNKLRAWSIPAGATAREAAGVVHSDFQEHFVRAEVFSVEDLRTHGSPERLREEGKIRVEGADYEVRDGDILRIKHDA